MDGGLRRVRFDETPVMSTYLLAFVVGDIKCVERRADDGTLVRVWATAGKESQGEFAAETSVRLLSFFNEYFGVPYPLPKLDHIAIPDFAAGAMENWGAVTYREVVLLVDPERDIRAGQAAHRRHNLPRDGAHVVRRPGDDGVVERPVAQRELRVVDRRQGRRLALPRLGDVDAVRLGRHQHRPEPGRPPQLPSHRAGCQGPGGDRAALRRDQLQQGRLDPPNARALPGRGDLPRGTAKLHLAPPVRQCRDPRPLERAGRGVGQAGCRDHGYVGPADRLPGAGRRGGLRGRSRRDSRLPVSLRLRAPGRPRRRGRDDVARARHHSRPGRRFRVNPHGRRADDHQGRSRPRRRMAQGQPGPGRFLQGQLRRRRLGAAAARRRGHGGLGHRPAGAAERRLRPHPRSLSARHPVPVAGAVVRERGQRHRLGGHLGQLRQDRPAGHG